MIAVTLYTWLGLNLLACLVVFIVSIIRHNESVFIREGDDEVQWLQALRPDRAQHTGKVA
ncbi:hypothetical protein MF271_04865 [Deinococcus sp. KNUC1210]|uniref:hypothetical protein n=1 Tax=Deinococcus sp. KNUC1210 TaxID=2917691 RepID=UPI001EEFA979|nr:hypothetical protein [Deinococcus sp. KNUC1210]ULH15966.1 hypothetical protein MF271_04865 [Deinococcus sp. KNUC1210]